MNAPETYVVTGALVYSGKYITRRLPDEGILRPTDLFGAENTLINNFAWMLRRFPVFGVFGDGQYRLQPIFIDDLAKLAVREGGRKENCIIDAIGPETFTYRRLVKQIGEIVGNPRRIISVPPNLGYINLCSLCPLSGWQLPPPSISTGSSRWGSGQIELPEFPGWVLRSLSRNCHDAFQSRKDDASTPP